MHDEPACLIEDYFAEWLRGTEHGRSYIARLGFDAAMDALFELLNAGLIKIEAGADGFTSIVPIAQPDPPKSPIRRPAK